MESVAACTGRRIQASVPTVVTRPKQQSAAIHRLVRDPEYFTTKQHGTPPRTATSSRSRRDNAMGPTQSESEYLPNCSSNTDNSNVPCHLKRVKRYQSRGLHSSNRFLSLEYVLMYVRWHNQVPQQPCMVPQESSPIRCGSFHQCFSVTACCRLPGCRLDHSFLSLRTVRTFPTGRATIPFSKFLFTSH